MQFILVIISCMIFSSFGYKDTDFTVQIAPMRRECFYQPTKAGKTIDVEYQVIDGGEMDINFMVQAPNGRVVMNEFKKNDGMHTIDPTTEGDYVICFDNSFSRMTAKTVFFEIIEDAGGEEADEDEGWKDSVVQDEAYGDKLASLEVAADKMSVIRNNLGKTSQLQGLLRAFEAKDRWVAERNYERVNMWSMLNIVAMLLVFGLQVFMVRNMFNDKKKVPT